MSRPVGAGAAVSTATTPAEVRADLIARRDLQAEQLRRELLHDPYAAVMQSCAKQRAASVAATEANTAAFCAMTAERNRSILRLHLDLPERLLREGHAVVVVPVPSAAGAAEHRRAAERRKLIDREANEAEAQLVAKAPPVSLAEAATIHRGARATAEQLRSARRARVTYRLGLPEGAPLEGGQQVLWAEQWGKQGESLMELEHPEIALQRYRYLLGPSELAYGPIWDEPLGVAKAALRRELGLADFIAAARKGAEWSNDSPEVQRIAAAAAARTTEVQQLLGLSVPPAPPEGTHPAVSKKTTGGCVQTVAPGATRVVGMLLEQLGVTTAWRQITHNGKRPRLYRADADQLAKMDAVVQRLVQRSAGQPSTHERPTPEALESLRLEAEAMWR